MRVFFFLLAVSLVLAGPLVNGQSTDGRSIDVVLPGGILKLNQGEMSGIPVNVRNAGELTIANLNVSLETPEGWHSSWGLITFLYMGVNETVTLEITPPLTAYGEYDISLRMVSSLSGLDVSRQVKVNVSGEKPPETSEEVVEEKDLKPEADEMISRARDSIQRALDSGLDVTSASNVFSRAVESYNEGNYAQAVEMAGLAYRNSEQIISEGAAAEEESAEGEPPEDGAMFDYTLILLLLVFIIIIIAVNKYFI